jgi:hypothetical protein
MVGYATWDISGGRIENHCVHSTHPNALGANWDPQSTNRVVL